MYVLGEINSREHFTWHFSFLGCNFFDIPHAYGMSMYMMWK